MLYKPVGGGGGVRKKLYEPPLKTIEVDVLLKLSIKVLFGLKILKTELYKSLNEGLGNCYIAEF